MCQPAPGVSWAIQYFPDATVASMCYRDTTGCRAYLTGADGPLFNMSNGLTIQDCVIAAADVPFPDVSSVTHGVVPLAQCAAFAVAPPTTASCYQRPC